MINQLGVACCFGSAMVTHWVLAYHWLLHLVESIHVISMTSYYHIIEYVSGGCPQYFRKCFSDLWFNSGVRTAWFFGVRSSEPENWCRKGSPQHMGQSLDPATCGTCAWNDKIPCDFASNPDSGLSNHSPEIHKQWQPNESAMKPKSGFAQWVPRKACQSHARQHSNTFRTTWKITWNCPSGSLGISAMLPCFLHSPPWPTLISTISNVVPCPAGSWMAEVHAENGDFQVIVGQAPGSAEAQQIQTDTWEGKLIAG